MFTSSLQLEDYYIPNLARVVLVVKFVSQCACSFTCRVRHFQNKSHESVNQKQNHNKDEVEMVQIQKVPQLLQVFDHQLWGSGLLPLLRQKMILRCHLPFAGKPGQYLQEQTCWKEPAHKAIAQNAKCCGFDCTAPPSVGGLVDCLWVSDAQDSVQIIIKIILKRPKNSKFKTPDFS